MTTDAGGAARGSGRPARGASPAPALPAPHRDDDDAGTSGGAHDDGSTSSPSSDTDTSTGIAPLGLAPSSGSAAAPVAVLRQRPRKLSDVSTTSVESADMEGSTDNVVGSSMTGLRYLVTSTGTQRLATFALNQILVRSTSQALYGFANVELELLMSTLVFVSREGVRLAAPRSVVGLKAKRVRNRDVAAAQAARRLQQDHQQRLINLSWIPVVVVVMLSLVFGGSQFLREAARASATPSADGESADDHNSGVSQADAAAGFVLYVGATVLRMFAEPAFILTQAHMRVGVRAALESVGTMIRLFITYVLVAWFSVGATAFGVAQVAYSAVLVVGFYGNFWWRLHQRQQRLARLGGPAAAAANGSVGDDEDDGCCGLESMWDLVPRRVVSATTAAATATGEGDEADVTNKSCCGCHMRLARVVARWFEPAQFSMAWAFTLQSIVKHLLTEGDKIVLTTLSSLEDQGVYAVVSNFGSLAARLLFQPLEESSRVMFSKLSHLHQALVERQVRRGTPVEAAGKVSAPMRQAAHIFVTLMKTTMTVGFVFMAFGTNYTFVLIDLLLGQRWSATSAPQVLALYCTYVLTMASNGMTESLVFAVADKAQVKALNTRMIGFFFVYAVIAWVLLGHIGVAGVVIASICNMTLRTLASWWDITRHFAALNRPIYVSEVVPPAPVLLSFVVSFGVTYASCNLLDQVTLMSKAVHVLVGAVCLCGVGAAVYLFDRSFVGEVRDLLTHRKQKLE